MSNHTDTFQPPDNGSGPNGKDVFNFVHATFLLVVMTLSSSWQLIMRKSGTVGTRATWMEYGFANILLLALRQFFPYSPCIELFTMTLLLMPAFFLLQFFRTVINKEHVHTHCLGVPWLGSELLEFVVGAAIGASIICLFPSAAPYGTYILACAGSLAIRGMMIEERDRLRSVQMENALWEQDYMMRNFERHKKGNK